MDFLHIVYVEMGPSPIQAESKFSQIGPSPGKEFPRKRLGFPWISLSELGLFKDLRGPPGPEISLAPLSPFRSTELRWHIAPARARNSPLLVSAGRAMWLRSFITPQYSDDFEFVKIFFDGLR
jgi:hypothetical protein